MKEHPIVEVKKDSIAEELGIEAGDRLLRVNGQEIEDVFDFDFLCEDSYIEVLIAKKNGEEWLLEVDKEPEEELGLCFDDGLMDNARSCKNKCIFCFIDQNPPGMRPTIYFKDDDTRLSFLQGNYVTLTNVRDEDIARIIRYRMEPINISVHTMDPKLRVFMLKNPRSGEVLRYLDELYEAGITMNGQIVLCKGVNDGEALDYTLERLLEYAPVMQSVSVVPVGLTKYREGLYPLEAFNGEDAEKLIAQVEGFQQRAMEKCGMHFVQASDEWYVLSGKEMPEAERYDGYLQLENGVGALRLLIDEAREAIEEERGKGYGKRTLSVACGYSAYNTLKMLCDEVMEAFPGLTVKLWRIRNDFFGEGVTVTGLITSQDLKAQLSGQELGEELLLPENMLRAGTEIFLDDGTVTELSLALQKKIVIVQSSGTGLVHALLGRGGDGIVSRRTNPYELDPDGMKR